MKQLLDKQWVHPTCAVGVPGSVVQRGRVNLSFEKVPLERWGQPCYICGKGDGAGLPCSMEDCTKHFHATCGATHGLDMSGHADGKKYGKKTAYCHDHSNSAVRSSPLYRLPSAGGSSANSLLSKQQGASSASPSDNPPSTELLHPHAAHSPTLASPAAAPSPLPTSSGAASVSTGPGALVVNLTAPPGAGSAAASATELDPDAVCSVCLNGDVEESNDIVFCDRCNVAVHQACYGVTSIPSGDWLCAPCKADLNPDELDCMLCPNHGGPYKPTADGRWAHVTCGQWIPETQWLDKEHLEPLGDLDRIPASRFRLLCRICRKRHGAVIQCSQLRCRLPFHPLCAQRAGWRMEVREAQSEVPGVPNDVVLVAYCEKHTSCEQVAVVRLTDSGQPRTYVFDADKDGMEDGGYDDDGDDEDAAAAAEANRLKAGISSPTGRQRGFIAKGRIGRQRATGNVGRPRGRRRSYAGANAGVIVSGDAADSSEAAASAANQAAARHHPDGPIEEPTHLWEILGHYFDPLTAHQVQRLAPYDLAMLQRDPDFFIPPEPLSGLVTLPPPPAPPQQSPSHAVMDAVEVVPAGASSSSSSAAAAAATAPSPIAAAAVTGSAAGSQAGAVARRPSSAPDVPSSTKHDTAGAAPGKSRPGTPGAASSVLQVVPPPVPELTVVTSPVPVDAALAVPAPASAVDTALQEWFTGRSVAPPLPSALHVPAVRWSLGLDAAHELRLRPRYVAPHGLPFRVTLTPAMVTDTGPADEAEQDIRGQDPPHLGYDTGAHGITSRSAPAPSSGISRVDHKFTVVDADMLTGDVSCTRLQGDVNADSADAVPSASTAARSTEGTASLGGDSSGAQRLGDRPVSPVPISSTDKLLRQLAGDFHIPPLTSLPAWPDRYRLQLSEQQVNELNHRPVQLHADTELAAVTPSAAGMYLSC